METRNLARVFRFDKARMTCRLCKARQPAPCQEITGCRGSRTVVGPVGLLYPNRPAPAITLSGAGSMPLDEHTFIKTGEVARLCGVSDETVRNWHRNGLAGFPRATTLNG